MGTLGGGADVTAKAAEADGSVSTVGPITDANTIPSKAKGMATHGWTRNRLFVVVSRKAEVDAKRRTPVYRAGRARPGNDQDNDRTRQDDEQRLDG